MSTKRTPQKPREPHVRDERLVRSWAREMLALKKTKRLTYAQIARELNYSTSTIIHILIDAEESGMGASHSMMRRVRDVVERLEAVQKKGSQRSS